MKKEKTPKFNSSKEAEEYYQKKYRSKILSEIGKSKTRRQQVTTELATRINKNRYKKALRRAIIQRQLEVAPVSTSLQIQQQISQQAGQRQRFVNGATSRAERLELWGLSLNEIPILREQEQGRMFMTSPPDRWMTRTIKSVTDEFPQ